MVYASYVRKPFSAVLSHFWAANCERAPCGAYLPEQVLSCSNTCPGKWAPQGPAKIASNMGR